MIYTKKGDAGKSATIHGYPAPKDAPVFQVLGGLDEIGANLGVAKCEAVGTLREAIALLQAQLLEVGACVAGGKEFDFVGAAQDFERLIDAYEAKTNRPAGFVLSGQTRLGALLDVARTVARRTERMAVSMTKTYQLKRECNPYFNRLSDLLYVMARYADTIGAKPADEISQPAIEQNKQNELDTVAAVQLCQKVLERARSMNLRAVCCVCNAQGNLMALIRDDDAFLVSSDVAQSKAWTAVSLKMSTKEALSLTENPEELKGLQYMNHERLLLLAGGQILKQGEVIAGGIGVSGGMAWQDEELSLYAKQIYENQG